ncbi:hypothetical protein K4K59_011781 [Colletotrichum sp. SAR11_240]|nr:hypothetical protein K4K59_011781 [Colletotrichum sp. SAR11_240]
MASTGTTAASTSPEDMSSVSMASASMSFASIPDTHQSQQLSSEASAADTSMAADHLSVSDADLRKQLLDLCREIYDSPQVRVRPDAIKSPTRDDIIDSLLFNLQTLCHTIVDASGQAHCEQR